MFKYLKLGNREWMEPVRYEDQVSILKQILDINSTIVRLMSPTDSLAILQNRRMTHEETAKTSWHTNHAKNKAGEGNMVSRIEQQAIRAMSRELYDSYQSKQITAEEVAKDLEEKIVASELQTARLRMIRNDVSTHMGNPEDRFDPAMHTHGFAELGV